MVTSSFSPWFIVIVAVSLAGFAAIALRAIRSGAKWNSLPVFFILLAAVLCLGYFSTNASANRESDRIAQLTNFWAPFLSREISATHEYIPASPSKVLESEGEAIRRLHQAKTMEWLSSNPDLRSVFTVRKSAAGRLVYVVGSTKSGTTTKQIQAGKTYEGDTKLMLAAMGGEKTPIPNYDEAGNLVSLTLAHPLKDHSNKTYGALCVELPADFWSVPVRSSQTFVLVMTAIMAFIVLAGGLLVQELVKTLANLRASKVQQQEQSAKIREQLDEMTKLSQESAAKQSELREAHDRLKSLATTDGLTGVLNHRTLMDALGYAMKQNSVVGSPCSVILLDVDNFKQLNDEFGHVAGDDALRTIAAVLRQSCPSGGYVGRYGGEEFMLVLPGASESVAIAVAEELCHRIQIAPMSSRPCTASFGVSTVYSMNKSEQTLIDEADRALYYSKRNGKNQVTHFGHGLLESA